MIVAAASPLSADERVFAAGGHRVRIRRARPSAAGSGPVIFLVHGMADSAATWKPLLPLLDGCDVWLFDLPWSGQGGQGWGGVMPSGDWWRAALAQCPVAPNLVLAHSFGAAVVLEWAAAALPSCALMLLAPLYRAAGHAISWDEIDRYTRTVPARLAAALTDRADRTLPEPLARAMGAKLAERLLPGGIIELFALLARLQHVPVEALAAQLALVVGDRDDASVHSGVEALAARAGIAPLRLAGCGHAPMHGDPGALAAAIWDRLLPAALQEVAA